jgi:hypothetical protein
MLLAIEITLNVIWIPVVCLGFALLGFMFTRSQIGSLKEKIRDLEKEMLQNHSEILSLQKENTMLVNNIKDNIVPVIPISSKENAEAAVDANHRKKLLSKPATTQA